MSSAQTVKPSLSAETTDQGPVSVKDILGRQKVGLLFSAILSVLGAFSGLVPYIVVYLIARDLFVDEMRTDRIDLFVTMAVGGVLGKAVFRMLANDLSHRCAYRALADTRIALAERLGKMPLARAQARSDGQVKKVFQDDVEQLELGLSHAIPDIAASLTVPMSVLAVMFWVDWRMALAGFAVVICVMACVAGAIVSTKDLMPAESEAKTRLNVSAVSFVRGIRVIRGFVGSSRAHRGLHHAIETNEKVESEKNRSGRVGATGATTFAAISTVFILPFGLFLHERGSLETADLVFFLLVGVGFAQPLMTMTLSAAVLQYQIESGLTNISSFLEEPDMPVPEVAREPEGSLVELDQVFFSYAESSVLDGVSLQIQPAERVALVGGSGAGKTTVLRLIARFLDVSDGAVRFGGVDVRHIDPSELTRAVAFIQQDDYIFNDTLMENIRLARPGASDQDVREAAEQARVADFIHELPEGWHTVLSPGGGRLSGGQRQRISIARAFLAQSKVVLLDEVTASLDASNERAVVEALTELQRGRTVITVAHRLGSLTGYDRILVMSQGRVVEEGTHGELLDTSSEYRALWEDFVAVDEWALSSDESRPNDSTGLRPGAGAPAEGQQPLDGQPEEKTPLITGLGEMGAVRQWLAMLGQHRVELWRVGLWRLLLEGVLTSAPVLVILVSLIKVLNGSLSSQDVMILSGVLWVIFIARWFVGYEVARAWWPIAGRAISDLRRSVVHRLMRAPLGVFDRMDAGRLSTLIVSDLALMDFINIPAKLIIACVQPVIVSIALFTIDWRLAAAALCGVPLFLLLLRASDRGHGEVSADVGEARRRANQALLEYCRGVAVLRAFPDAPQAHAYRQSTEELRRASVRMAVRTSPMTALATVILEAGFVLLLALGAALFQNASLSAVTLLLFLVVALNLYRPFQELLELSAYRHQQAHIAESLGEVWDIEELPEPAEPRIPQDSTVEFSEVWFSYGEVPVLRDVSFVSPPSSVTALVGPSGAGKSTVANLVTRFWDPDSGAVTLGGVDVREIAPEVRRDWVTTVYQEVYLFPDTVRANLIIGNPSAGHEQIRAALEAAEASDFIEKLPDGIDTVLEEGGTNLSGGQRQRLAIARALLKDAPVLLLDEAVAAVDPATERRIQAALSRLVSGRTVLVVAHRLNTVETADQILVMDQGTIDGAGKHPELVESSQVYRELQGVAS